MKYSLTIFKSIFDNKTHRKMDFPSWDKFEDLLYSLSKQPFKTKKDAYLISPSSYLPDTTRANKNVVSWSWAAVDVDDHKFEGDLETELRNKYGEHYYVCYSTASSTPEHPKFRLVFPLTETVKADDIRKFWFALNSELGGIGDKQTKDLSRMYYIPGDYEGSYRFIFTNKGSIIEPKKLMDKYPYIQPEGKGKTLLDKLPPELQKAVIDHRKQSLPNREKYSWLGLHDCPFVNKKMISEYKCISETGWFHKMYQFMVSIAFNAIRNGYPITDFEIEQLARELDRETGNWYENRPIRDEANSALTYAYRNSEV